MPRLSSPRSRRCCSRSPAARSLPRRRGASPSASGSTSTRFTRWLAERGCHGTTAVELPGEFSLRGGILDVFPPDALDPLRIELFDDEVESIRTFDVATQRSLETLDAADVTVLAAERQVPHALHQLPAGGQLVHARRAGGPRRRRPALPSAAGAARGFLRHVDDAARELQVSVGDRLGRAGGVVRDDGPPAVRIGRAVQRRRGAACAPSSTRPPPGSRCTWCATPTPRSSGSAKCSARRS